MRYRRRSTYGRRRRSPMGYAPRRRSSYGRRRVGRLRIGYRM